MSVLRAFFVIGFLFPSLALAGQIEVRAGEHGGFTRLVLHLPEAMRWSAQQVEAKVSVNVDNEDARFDLSRVFTRIGHERVASVRSVGNQLEIELGCDCSISSHTNGERMVVIDVAEAKVIPEKVAQDPPSSSLNLIFSDRLSRGELVQSLQAQVGPHSFAANGANEARLLEHLSRAASLGLLELSDEPKYLQKDAIPPRHNSELQTSNVSAHLGLAATAAAHFDTENRSETGMKCPSDNNLNIARWAAHQDFFKGLTALRGELGGEVAVLQEDVAIALAKHYLHFAFSDEALELLQQVEPSGDTDFLISLAYVIDDRTDSLPTNLSKFASCKNAISMWALLSIGSTQKNLNIHPHAIISAFSELPETLQIQVGPRLGEALLGQKLQDEARYVLRLVELQQRQPSPEYNFAEARSQFEQGHTESVALKLRETVGADSPISPVALVALIENEVSSGQAPSPEMIELWTSYEHQYRNTEVAPQLRRAMMSALTQANQFEEAWRLVEMAEKSGEDVVGFPDEFLNRLTKFGSDLEFLRHGLRLKNRVRELSPDIAQRAEQRFNSMGFFDLATAYSSGLAQGRGDSDLRRLQAETQLEQRNTLAKRSAPLALAGDDVEVIAARSLGGEEALVQPIDNAPTIPPVQASLSSGYAALSESQGLRSRLEELLEETALDRNDKR